MSRNPNGEPEESVSVERDEGRTWFRMDTDNTNEDEWLRSDTIKSAERMR